MFELMLEPLRFVWKVLWIFIALDMGIFLFFGITFVINVTIEELTGINVADWVISKWAKK